MRIYTPQREEQNKHEQTQFYEQKTSDFSPSSHYDLSTLSLKVFKLNLTFVVSISKREIK